ncbi:MAG TPA: hypothetical protein PLB41_08085 [Rubrivivax sp.]|nr:hypothetical protein [Rubrivivax sp.]HPO18973.1 hypothetical protein [Rubrivivax sp.]
MGIDVVQGPTRFRVPAHKTRAFERVFEGARLDDYWTLVKDERGTVTGLELRGLPGRPCDAWQMDLLSLFVEDGSFVTLETAWGDDAWRWTYRRGRMTERTVAAGCRAR